MTSFLLCVWKIPRFSLPSWIGGYEIFLPTKRHRFILQILYKNATMYLHYHADH